MSYFEKYNTINTALSLMYNDHSYDQILSILGDDATDMVERAVETHSRLLKEKSLLLKLTRLEDADTLGQDDFINIHWGYLVYSCIYHKTVNLVWDKIRRLNLIRHIPAQTIRFFNAMYYSNSLRNKDYLAELVTIDRLLKENDIEILCAKGAFLIHNLYNIHSRSVSDMDVFARESDLKRITRVLTENGYQFSNKFDWSELAIIPMSRKQELFWQLESHNLPPLSKKSDNPFLGAFNIDVSTKFFLKTDRYSFDIDGLFSRADTFSLNDSTLNVLCKEDFLIHLCCHLFREAKSDACMHIGQDLNLIKFCDINEFINRFEDGIDWDLFVQIIKDNGIAEPVYFSLYYTKLIYNNDSIDEILQRIEPENMDFLYNEELDSDGIYRESFFNRLFNNGRRVIDDDSFFDKLERMK